MNEEAIDHLTPRVITWWGLLFLVAAAAVCFLFFGREVALGMGIGMGVGLANFKAIAFILRRVLGPSSIHKMFYGIFGFLKFGILVSVFFILIHFQLFDVYGIVVGFSAVLLLVMIEGLVRASRYSRDALTEEKVNA